MLDKPPNESDVVMRAIQGDRSAFGLLYDQYQIPIFRYLSVKVNGREIARDLTQVVFVRALENIVGYRNKGSPFSSWLYEIARNLVIDYYRTRREHKSIDDPEESDSLLPFFVQEPEANIDFEANLQLIDLAMETLSDPHRQILVMRFFEERPIREVAEMLEKTESAVKVLQHRATKELAKAFRFYQSA